MAEIPLRIRDLPAPERPREKLASLGSSALSDAELIALFLGTGRRGHSAIDLARELLRRFGSLRGIAGAAHAELASLKGIGPAKAAQLTAALEFGRRLATERVVDCTLDEPAAVYDLLAPEMSHLQQESLRVVLLNTRHRLIRSEEITRGSLNESVAHPREILRSAIAHAAYAFILVHNHPSGDPAPSQADRALTRRLVAASREVGIELLDHVIIGAPRDSSGGGAYFSFAEAGLL